MAQGYVLAIDQGTTGTTALLVDSSARVLWQSKREIGQVYPHPGWVEQDPYELFRSCLEVMEELLEETEVSPRQVVAVGLTNQRETTVVWERETGRPVANAVVWQCRRTAPLCQALQARGMEPEVRRRTGLPIDAYFSATKLRWLLDHTPQGQRRAEAGELLFGTVDTWLLWNLTGGAVHATDVSNASRTMLFNIETLEWDDDLLEALEIPRAVLPQVLPSSHVFGEVTGDLPGLAGLPISGVAGDQQAALFGQACFVRGMAKNTYGTGAFLLMNTGGQMVRSSRGLVTTVAWRLGDGPVTYALEGSIFATGATVQWLRDGLGIIARSEEVEELARSVPDNGGVYMVPAFAGLGAPHWDMYARGTIVGITRGTGREHLARAALESTAYQTRDVVEAMALDTGVRIPLLRVDGGATANELLLQFQADILGMPIERSAVAETTALGAAYLAGLAVGLWQGLEDLAERWAADRRFEPRMDPGRREALYRDWLRAVDRARGWAAAE